MSIQVVSGRPAERGATLAGYALVVSLMTVVGLGSMAALETVGGEFLATTGDRIGTARESADELARTPVSANELPNSAGSGGSTTTATTQSVANPPDGVLPDVIGECLGEPGITAVELRNQGWVDFDGCDLGLYGPLDLSGFDLSDARIKGGAWDGTIFDGANLFKTEFKELSMNNARFVGAIVQELFVKDFSMVEANFAGTDLTDAKFQKGDLRGSDFSSTRLVGAEFKDVAAAVASFADATIIDTKMTKLDAANATFAGATMENVDMERANARNANFADASLNEVKLRRAVIQAATFQGADFDEVDLDKAEGEAQLGSTGTWSKVKCPDGEDDTPPRSCTWLR